MKKVCNTCGSENVVKDAWTEWDTDKQDWVLKDVFDNEYCEDYERETTIIDKE